MTLTNPDEQTFESIIKEKKFVIAKFFGTWCGPCKMLSFLFDSIIEKYEDKITFVNIDIDKEQFLILYDLKHLDIQNPKNQHINKLLLKIYPRYRLKIMKCQVFQD